MFSVVSEVDFDWKMLENDGYTTLNGESLEITAVAIKKMIFKYLYIIYILCLSVLVSVCPFVSNKRQKGWTDRAQFFCGISRDPH